MTYEMISVVPELLGLTDGRGADRVKIQRRPAQYLTLWLHLLRCDPLPLDVVLPVECECLLGEPLSATSLQL
jgi:hypothetical protein